MKGGEGKREKRKCVTFESRIDGSTGFFQADNRGGFAPTRRPGRYSKEGNCFVFGVRSLA